MSAPGHLSAVPGGTPLTQAVLAAAIIVNLKGMLKQFTDIRSLWKANQVDLVRGLRSRGWGWGWGPAAGAPLELVDHCPSAFSSSGW